MNEEELLYNEIYKKTKDCDRNQFIKLLMEERRKNAQLQKQLQTTANSCKQENNVIDELEKWLEEEKRLNGDVTMEISKVLVAILKKIKKLKGE